MRGVPALLRPTLSPCAWRLLLTRALAPVHHAELIRSKGDTTMTVEELTAEIIPRGRGKLPLPPSRAGETGAPQAHACPC